MFGFCSTLISFFICFDFTDFLIYSKCTRNFDIFFFRIFVDRRDLLALQLFIHATQGDDDTQFLSRIKFIYSPFHFASQSITRCANSSRDMFLLETSLLQGFWVWDGGLVAFGNNQITNAQILGIHVFRWFQWPHTSQTSIRQGHRLLTHHSNIFGSFSKQQQANRSTKY